MSDTRSLFARLTARKPKAWDAVDMISYGRLTDAQREALAGLPVIQAPGEPWDNIEFTRPTMECVVVHDGNRYYANTEGYSYPRHLVQIVNWPAEEEQKR